MSDQTLEEYILSIRDSIKQVAKKVKEHKRVTDKIQVREGEDRGEVMANLTLSYRHLEDSSMRLGKVLQALNGGVSSYNNRQVDNTVVGSPE